MGLWQRLMGSEQPVQIEEAAAQPLPDLPTIARMGYEYGVPLGGVNSDERAKIAGNARSSVMEQLYNAYLACAPAAACVDTTARLVTAGGLQLVPEDGTDDQERPPRILQLDALMRSTNAQEDLIQLMRSTITDLLVFGDGFVEVGSVAQIVASLWSLDATTVTVKCDEHGEVTGFVQAVDSTRVALFDPDEVIHVSLDSPRGGIYGVSPMQKLMIPITTWLFTQGVLKEYMRQGAAPRIAVDLGKSTNPVDRERWMTQYVTRNTGPRNQSKPVVTAVHPDGQAGPPPIMQLNQEHVADLHATIDLCRDQMVSGFGMVPAMIGIIESGNLGGGTGESQARTFHYGTVIPLQNILLEKLNYRLLQSQGIQGWKFQFGEVEYRDSKDVEAIRDLRLRNGSWTLNQYLSDIGVDTIPDGEGGDLRVIVDRSNILAWADLEAFSKSQVEKNDAPAIAAGLDAQGRPTAPGQPPTPGQAPAAVAAKGAPAASAAKPPTKESLSEAWTRAYEAALRDIPRS